MRKKRKKKYSSAFTLPVDKKVKKKLVDIKNVKMKKYLSRYVFHRIVKGKS